MSTPKRTLKATVEIDGLDRPGLKRAPFCREVESLQALGTNPNVYIFAGAECWERADERRVKHGAGSALGM